MDISVDHVNDLKKVCNLFIEKDKFNSQLSLKINDFQQNARIKGFRAGKVKVDFIKRKYGAAIEQEMVSEMIDDAWKKIIKDNNFKPVSQPVVDVKGVEKDGFRAQLSFEIAPTITPLEPSDFSFEHFDFEVKQTHLDKIVDDLKHQYGDTKDKEGNSVLGDIVVANVKKSIVGEENSEQEMTDQSILLDDDKTLPVIVKHLTDTAKGDVKEFQHTYDKDWHEKSLAGKEASFVITVTNVQTLEKCSLETVKENVLGSEEEMTEEQIFEKIGDFAKVQADQKVFEKNKENVLEFLVEKHEFALPESLEADAKKEGSDETIKERLDSLRLGFIIDSYVSSWDIKVGQEAIESQIRRMASQFGMPAQQLLPLISKNEQIQQNIQNEALIDTFVNSVLDKVSIEKTTLGYDELMK